MKLGAAVAEKYALAVIIAVAIIAYVAGYVSHKETYYYVVPSTVTETVLKPVTERVTLTETRVVEPKIYTYNQIESVKIDIKADSLKFRVYLTNTGNATLYGIKVYLLSRDNIAGIERLERVDIDELEPGVTRVAEFSRFLLAHVVFLIITQL